MSGSHELQCQAQIYTVTKKMNELREHRTEPWPEGLTGSNKCDQSSIAIDAVISELSTLPPTGPGSTSHRIAK